MKMKKIRDFYLSDEDKEKIRAFEQKYEKEIKNKEFYKVPPITIINGRILI